jgi:two-component system, NtrC family, sensor kinase
MNNKKRNVLIVDDDVIICNLLEKELLRNYFNTQSANNGTDALKILEKKKIDILLLDIKLPDIDGLEMLKKVKATYPDCEVIIITGYGNIDNAILSLKNGATDYIEKPIESDDISAACGRAIERLIKKEKLSYKNTILVIDDDISITRSIKKILEKEEFHVFKADSGEAGLKIIENNKVDIVISDIKLSGMDGIEILRKAKGYYSDIEVILVTGYKEESLSIEALRAGAFDYISKPINLDELLISIQKAIKTIELNRTYLYRNRELKISSQIIAKMNEDLEKKIEERTIELNKTQTQLFQTSKLATLGEMSAGLAHEINQPLGAISLIATTFRKLLAREKLTKDEIESGLDDIDASVFRMKKIIEHIRTFARQDTLKFIEVKINDTIESALTLLGEQLRLHDIKILFDNNVEIPSISGEPYQLEQVWINFLANARDALDEKKKEFGNFVQSISIQANYDKESNHITIIFKDNGKGMSKQVLNRAIEPFFTTKEVGKATGLGLAISYGIIENHKGTIEIQSIENVETQIHVTLPVLTK